MNLEEWPDSDLVAEILDAETGLTDWEIEFAENCHRIAEKHYLTDRQRTKAIEIIRRLRDRD